MFLIKQLDGMISTRDVERNVRISTRMVLTLGIKWEKVCMRVAIVHGTDKSQILLR